MTSPAARSRVSRPLGDVLVDSGAITRVDLDRALEYRQVHGGKLGQALVSLGLVSETVLADALRQQGKVQCIHLSHEIVNPSVAVLLDENVCRKHRAIAINRIADHVTVAMEDPFDVCAVDEISVHVRTKVLAVYAEPRRILQCIDRVFSRSRTSDGPTLDELVESPELAALGVKLQGDQRAEDVDLEGQGGPVIDLVQNIIESAFQMGASDIHLEPRSDKLVVRVRVDGVLQERLVLNKSWARPLLARLKIMSQLDIAQKRMPQDGRARAHIGRREIDLRVATTPTLMGEGAVLRILDGGRELQSLEHLGLTQDQLETVYRMVDGSDACVLATGPTGSGKTTTLYALLQHLHSPDTKIITLEDPVENVMEGITQINANSKIGLTFAHGLRSILRQDPDVVLVGEIRDPETAEIAVQAALTGHMVLSTLHTTGSVESITRLREMGVEPYLLADTLRGIVAQRLVRKICEVCKRQAQVDRRLLRRLELPDDGATYFEGTGCSACFESGYRGRLGLYEILEMTPEICDILRAGGGPGELRKASRATGLSTLRMEGIRRAQAGETSLLEVVAATARG